MSVAALAPCPGWIVADACAAPGNKTTQAAAYVGSTGAVLACERDPRRFEILQVVAVEAVARPLLPAALTRIIFRRPSQR
jgi:putative methyltransferase